MLNFVGSTDATICLWSLDDLSLLNSVTLASPVKLISVSPDSFFMLAACENNQLYLHALATGSEVHCLRGHKAEVTNYKHKLHSLVCFHVQLRQTLISHLQW